MTTSAGANNSRIRVCPGVRFGFSSFILYVIAALVVTWPLMNAIGNLLPIGTESSLTVPLFNLWTLEWNAQCIASAYDGYWNAPIFFPYEGAFALSEPQPLTGVVYAAFRWLTASPILSYNLILLTALTLNGVIAQRFFLQTGASRTPAMLGGLFAVFLPLISQEQGVLQLTMVFPVFGVMGSLWNIPRRRHSLSGVRLGLWFIVSFLTCSYYALFMSPLLSVACIAMLIRSKHRMRLLARLATAAVVVAVTVLPIASVQSGTMGKFSRRQHERVKTSAQLMDYTRLPSRALGGRFVPWLNTHDDGAYNLYPGTWVVVLTVGAVALSRGKRRRRSIGLLLLVAGLSLVFSLSGHLQIRGWQPFEIFFEYWPGFSAARNLFRFAIFFQVALLTIAVTGLHALYRYKSLRGLLIVLSFVGLLEIMVPHSRTRLIKPGKLNPAWADSLADVSPGPVVLLPIPKRGRARDYEQTVEVMLALLPHECPLVNGYSGFFPRATIRKLRRVRKRGVEELRQSALDVGARYVVADTAWFARAGWTSEHGKDSDFRVLFADEDFTLIEFDE